MRISSFITLFSLLIIVIISGYPSAQEINAPHIKKNNLTNERKQALMHLLKQDCGSCHGLTLKGGLGPALLPKNLKDKPTLFITNTILLGRPGTAMPPWQGILTEQEVSWLTVQLQNGISPSGIPPETNKDLAKKELLNESH